MKFFKFVFVFSTLLCVIFSASAFDMKKIDYKRRLEKLRNINSELANRVESAQMLCFGKDKFNLMHGRKIPGGGPLFWMAKMHAFDMEKGLSHARGLDDRRKKEENHPGRLVMDLITDMIKEEMLNSNIKTYEVLMRIACSTNKLLAKFKLTGHWTTTAENKITRSSGGNCWDYSHVGLRIAKALNIPLERKTRGVHMFLAYKLTKIKDSPIYFAIDPLFCKYKSECYYEFLGKNLKTLARFNERVAFFEGSIKKEKCFVNTMKNDPSKFLYFK